jgi:mannose-1-phosphate guanylyltransferase/mannose-6-phosphate isomerase
MPHTYAVILAGGTGSRFWPLSRELEPKQFLSFNAKKSLLQQTIERVLPLVPKENILIVGSTQHKFELEGQLGRYAIPIANIILEPCGKNTAPAIGLAARVIEKRDPQAIMIVLPADHYISRPDKLIGVLKKAVQASQDGNLITIGIKPTSAHTGYGYIKSQGKKVVNFTEKPDKKTAEKYVKAKTYFWNSGMFIWKAQVILEEIKKHLPDLNRQLLQFRLQSDIDPKKWGEISSVSIDYGVLEKSNRVVVIPAGDIGWSDLGSWSAFSAICKKDKDNNVIQADCIDIDSQDISVFGKDRLIATIGLKDVVVVDTDDALLVCSKSRAEEVKKVVEQIKGKKRQEHYTHKTVKRPWGTYSVINMGNGFKVKLVQIAPHKRLSLQRHMQRSEHWVVVEGEAKITVDRDVYFRKANQSIYVPKKGIHRLENSGNIPLKIVEVQCGQYLEEDDIERMEDDFERG